MIPLWIARKLGRLARIVIPSPAAWIIAALAALEVAVGQIAIWLTISLALACLVALAFWRMQFPDGFQRHIAGRARGTARSLLVYRWRWSRGLQRSGVISKTGGTPLLVRTSSTPVFDRLQVRMVAGQRVEDFAEENDRLAQTFGALACRASHVLGKPHRLELMFL